MKETIKKEQISPPETSTILRMGRILRFMTFSQVRKPTRSQIHQLPEYKLELRLVKKELVHLIFIVTCIPLFLVKSQ